MSECEFKDGDLLEVVKHNDRVPVGCKAVFLTECKGSPGWAFVVVINRGSMVVDLEWLKLIKDEAST